MKRREEAVRRISGPHVDHTRGNSHEPIIVAECAHIPTAPIEMGVGGAFACPASQEGARTRFTAGDGAGRFSRRSLRKRSPPQRTTATAAFTRVDIQTGAWRFRGHSIRYQRCGAPTAGGGGPSLVCVHGFGGNCDHWRRNLSELATALPGSQVFAIDLLGYGYSSKPPPAPGLYSFETFAEQLRAFQDEVVRDESGVFLVCNSVGGVAGLQAALDAASDAGGPGAKAVRGVVLLNVSHRGLHVSKQPPPLRPLIAAFQWVLRETPLGQSFFGAVATPQAVQNVLRQAYCDPAQVTDELVECILRPGLEPGASAVFLDFISYSSGPLPERQLEALSAAAGRATPVAVVWGREDPWESVQLARQNLRDHACVERFVELPGVGHCPQDEAPQLVNPVVVSFVNDIVATTTPPVPS